MKLVVLGWWFKLAGKHWLGLQAHLPSSWLLPLAGSLCCLSLPHHQASPALDCHGSTHIALLCWLGLIDFRSFCYQNTKLHPLLWSAALGCESWAGRCLGANLCGAPARFFSFSQKSNEGHRVNTPRSRLSLYPAWRRCELCCQVPPRGLCYLMVCLERVPTHFFFLYTISSLQARARPIF